MRPNSHGERATIEGLKATNVAQYAKLAGVMSRMPRIAVRIKINFGIESPMSISDNGEREMIERESVFDEDGT